MELMLTLKPYHPSISIMIFEMFNKGLTYKCSIISIVVLTGERKKTFILSIIIKFKFTAIIGTLCVFKQNIFGNRQILVFHNL